MPKIVVRKSYRCQPGRRREVLTALQKMDAAVAEAGYPRGRYVLVETRAPGEPDLEVEFTFESYAEMERLDRAMRERRARRRLSARRLSPHLKRGARRRSVRRRRRCRPGRTCQGTESRPT